MLSATWAQVQAGTVSSAWVVQAQQLYQGYYAPAFAQVAAQQAQGGSDNATFSPSSTFGPYSALPYGGDFDAYLASIGVLTGTRPANITFLPTPTQTPSGVPYSDGTSYSLYKRVAGVAQPERLGYVASGGVYKAWKGGYQKAATFSQDWLENLTIVGIGALAAAGAAGIDLEGSVDPTDVISPSGDAGDAEVSYPTASSQGAAGGNSDAQALYGDQGYGSTGDQSLGNAAYDSPSDTGQVANDANQSSAETARLNAYNANPSNTPINDDVADTGAGSAPTSSAGPANTAGTPSISQLQSAISPLAKLLGFGPSGGTRATPVTGSNTNPFAALFGTNAQGGATNQPLIIAAIVVVAAIVLIGEGN